MTLVAICSFALIGIISGILSGLLGIGGGVIIIPGLMLVFQHLDLSSDLMHLAIGTSLASMIFNTLSASYSHYKKNAVLFPVVKPMGLGICVGALCGAYLARLLPSYFLQVFFGVFECILGIYLFFPSRKVFKHRTLPKFWGLSTIAVGVSTFSTILGVGGGLINVPLLCYFNTPLKKAIGTSSALSFLISVLGAASFFIFGMHASDSPDSIGFLYLPGFIVISIAALFAAPYGVKLAHYFPTNLLKKIFGIALIITGVIMILS